MVKITTPDKGSEKSIFIVNIIFGAMLPIISILVTAGRKYSNASRGSIRIRGNIIGTFLTFSIIIFLGGINALAANGSPFAFFLAFGGVLGAIIILFSTIKTFFISPPQEEKKQEIEDPFKELIRKNSIFHVDIAYGIKAIEPSAYRCCGSLTTVNIPDSVQTIGKEAFAFCGSIVNINLPNSLKTIGEEAFQMCSGLKEITIPDSVETIGKNAFQYCRSLERITISNNLKVIPENGFCGCSSLKEVTVPQSVTTICTGAFSSCEELKRVFIPKSVIFIEPNAFIACPKLTIYCEASSAPEGWEGDEKGPWNWAWNDTRIPVVWGYEPQ